MNSPGLPRCLTSDVQFKHKAEVLSALQAGATIRRDDRVISAEAHHATYCIRLDIAKDSRITRGYEQEAVSAVKDMELFLSRLRQDLATPTRAWHVSAAGGQRFTIVENEATSEVLGCLRGHVQDKAAGHVKPLLNPSIERTRPGKPGQTSHVKR